MQKEEAVAEETKKKKKKGKLENKNEVTWF